MNASDFEHELTVLLHRHAEDAMRSTDTHEEHQEFLTNLQGRSGRVRRRWAVGGAAAAAVAALAGFALWSADFGDRVDSGPARETQTTEEEVAQNFVEAVSAGDIERVRSFLTPEAMDDYDWRGELRENESLSREYILKPCVEASTSPAWTTVYCPFDMHVLHSEQLGLGPFTNNAFTIRVKDGRVVSAEDVQASGPDSHDQMIDVIGEWVRENHPGKWGFMYDPRTHTPAEMQRWHRLWEVYSQEYADEMTQEGDGDSAQDN